MPHYNYKELFRLRKIFFLEHEKPIFWVSTGHFSLGKKLFFSSECKKRFYAWVSKLL